jgi:hypothetical protein
VSLVPSSRRGASLMRFRCGEFSMRLDPQLIGFTAIAALTSFKVRSCDMSSHRSLGSIKNRAHLPSRRSSSELLHPFTTPFHLSMTAHLPLGSFPSSRHRMRAATFFREASHAPLRSARRFSQPLGGFFRSHVCGLIPSRSHVQGSSSFRGFSPDTAVLLHQKAPSSLSLLHRRSSARSDFHRLELRPRTMPLDFEAFIRAGPRSSGLVIHRARSRSPLRISRSSRFVLSRR